MLGKTLQDFLDSQTSYIHVYEYGTSKRGNSKIKVVDYWELYGLYGNDNPTPFCYNYSLVVSPEGVILDFKYEGRS